MKNTKRNGLFILKQQCKLRNRLRLHANENNVTFIVHGTNKKSLKGKKKVFEVSLNYDLINLSKGD